MPRPPIGRACQSRSSLSPSAAARSRLSRADDRVSRALDRSQLLAELEVSVPAPERIVRLGGGEAPAGRAESGAPSDPLQRLSRRDDGDGEAELTERQRGPEVGGAECAGDRRGDRERRDEDRKVACHGLLGSMSAATASIVDLLLCWRARIDVCHLGTPQAICCHEVDGVLVDPGPESTVETLLGSSATSSRARCC